MKTPDQDFVRGDYFALCQFVGACRAIARGLYGDAAAIERLRVVLGEYETTLAQLKAACEEAKVTA